MRKLKLSSKLVLEFSYGPCIAQIAMNNVKFLTSQLIEFSMNGQ
jgi:hypothetical protein